MGSKSFDSGTLGTSFSSTGSGTRDSAVVSGSLYVDSARGLVPSGAVAEGMEGFRIRSSIQVHGQ